MMTNITEKASKIKLIKEKLKRSYIFTSKLRNNNSVLFSAKLSACDISRLIEKTVLPNRVKKVLRKEYNLPDHTEESDYDSEETVAND